MIDLLGKLYFFRYTIFIWIIGLVINYLARDSISRETKKEKMQVMKLMFVGVLGHNLFKYFYS